MDGAVSSIVSSVRPEPERSSDGAVTVVRVYQLRNVAAARLENSRREE